MKPASYFFRLCFLALSFYTLVGFTQEAPKDQVGTWTQLVGTHQIANNWSIPTVGILRQYNYAESVEFGFLRVGANYKLNSNTYIGAGVAFLDHHPFEKVNSLEQKSQFWLYQEMGWKHSKKFAQRFRLEHRWKHSGTTHTFGPRLRHRLQFTQAVDASTYIKVSNEHFLELNEFKIMQNRFFIGLGKKITPNLCLELGYLKNHVGKENYDRLRFSLYFKTKLYKDKQNKVAQQEEKATSQ
ncbi:DUF2490 domain-containing protein [Croceivirga sp. JEA036]|uniref:DUF2490 domain-containing protein n=1 Tax=Croceivirga sp. JEA036 TaxID=2721162 RepID=UPI00143C9F7E|nr:DUF2490 domain-containing protein [Croceivirga sp. JEA036]NJB35270.1 DUF2490 domain-containing protein [Croceivirga sp. JEA036]